MIDQILKPLLEVDGGSIELVDAHGEEVVVRLLGDLRGDPSAPAIKSRVIEPAIQAAARRKVKVRYDLTPPDLA